MTEKELKQKLNEYMDLKEWIEEYNREQLQNGLDLGSRIVSDVLNKFPYDVGEIHLEWEDDWRKRDLILKMKKPFENNGLVHGKIVDYIVNRYPDTKKHYLGVLIAECVPFNNIDDYMGELQKKDENND